MPKNYLYSFALFAVLVSPLALFLISVGFKNLSFPHIAFWGGVLVLIWFAFFGLKNNKPKYLGGTFLIITPIWILLLLRTIQRVQFVIENGGMEKADGYGSPAAFLVGAAFEQILFIPTCFIVFFGTKHFLNLYHAKRNSSIKKID